MEDTEEEKTPLIQPRNFRTLSQSAPEPAVVQCCCVESKRLGRVPVIRTLFKKNSEKGTFSSSFGVLLTMLGSVVGTGNIWRFPRIMANNATEDGALGFLLVWFAFLWLWSLPLILLEYGVGRFTRKSTVESFGKLLGPGFRFMGAFQAFIAICIGSYYSVVVGWCGYYFVHICANPLPVNETSSMEIWDDLQASNWPVFFHTLSIVVAGVSVLGGVATIEAVNKVIVPILLVLLVFSFYWAIFLPYAADGIIFMFSPSWDSLKSAQLWLDAISQNAWDTGGGSGSFLNYASFMKRSQGAVRLGTITPLMNNLVSLICGILIFSTVFSVQLDQGFSRESILTTLRYNDEGNAGLTFIWMPLLYGNITHGKVLAIIFFLCIAFAGISSLISIMERPVHVLTDFGIRRVPATIGVSLCMFLLGTASAVDESVLVNQDSVWAYALILSGCFLLILALHYGPLKFRKDLFLDYGIGDWPLPIIWVFAIVFIAPIEGVGLIIWWIVEKIMNNPGTWWQITVNSLATVLTEWAVVLLVFIGLNWWLSPLIIYEPRKRKWRRLLGFLVILQPGFSPPPSPGIETPRNLDSGSDDMEGSQYSISMYKKKEAELQTGKSRSDKHISNTGGEIKTSDVDL